MKPEAKFLDFERFLCRPSLALSFHFPSHPAWLREQSGRRLHKPPAACLRSVISTIMFTAPTSAPEGSRNGVG